MVPKLQSIATAIVLGAAIGGLFALAPVLAQSNGERPISLVAAFDPEAGEFPEGITKAADGSFLVTMAFTGEVRRITRDGQSSTFGNVAQPGDGFVTGIVQGSDGSVFVAVASFDPETHGVWRLSADGSISERFAELDASGLPNGLLFHPSGDLLVSDSIHGRIWAVAPDGGQSVWYEHEALSGLGGPPFDFPVGANGIAFGPARTAGNAPALLVANTQRGSIVEVVLDDESRPADVEPGIIQNELLVGADGIDVGADGTVYVVIFGGQDRIVRVNPDGGVETLAEGGVLQDPASVVLHGDELIFTNFAAFRALGLVEVDPEVGILVGVYALSLAEVDETPTPEPTPTPAAPAPPKTGMGLGSDGGSGWTPVIAALVTISLAAAGISFQARRNPSRS